MLYERSYKRPSYTNVRGYPKTLLAHTPGETLPLPTDLNKNINISIVLIITTRANRVGYYSKWRTVMVYSKVYTCYASYYYALKNCTTVVVIPTPRAAVVVTPR